MKLSVLERLVLTNQVLPEKGDFLTMSTVDAARQVLSLSEKEAETVAIRKVGDKLEWDQEAVSEAEIELSASAIVLIKQSLSTLETKKELNAHTAQLYKRFVMSNEGD